MKTERRILLPVWRWGILCLVLASVSGCFFGLRYFLDDGLRLAHDAQTGEYIGVVVGECTHRDTESGQDKAYYRIEQQNGEIIEKEEGRIRLNQP